MYASTLAGGSASARAAYTSHSVGTASPARLLVMLMDRLVLDIERGIAAIDAADWPASHSQLTHAQDIVMELQASLDVDAMPAGSQLAALYEFLRGRLVTANIRRDAGVAAEALTLARDLADMWRQAALAAVAQ